MTAYNLYKNLLALLRPKRLRVWIPVVVVAFILTVLSYNRFHIRHLPLSESVWVEAEKVKRGNIPVEVHAVGSLVAERQVTITSEMPGQVAKLFFKDGSFVSKGT